MNVIFLDFDGVITTAKSKYNLDKDSIALLGEIIDVTDAKIVISSSWRMHTLEDTIDYLKIINQRKPFIFPYLDRVIGITSRMYGFKHGEIEEHYRIARGVEIDRYYRENDNIYNYVILDDDNDMLAYQIKHFVKTNSYIGLTKSDVKKAIRILNK